MDLKDLASKVLGFAPLVGTALGGPAGALAGTAVKSLASAFGLSPTATPDEIHQAISTDPQAALKLHQAELDFQAKQTDQKLDELKAYLSDMQAARTRDLDIRKLGKLNFRADLMLLAAFLAVIVIAVILCLGGAAISGSVIGFLTTIGGMFARNIGTAFDFEFGSSRGSMEKTQLLAEAEPVKPKVK